MSNEVMRHKKIIIFLLMSLCTGFISSGQHSVAREWNEQLLEAIRNDYARPTVHARNLFHSSMIMYDAWAIFDAEAETVFLGKKFGTYTSTFNGISQPADIDSAIHEVLSYAMFRLLNHRFDYSPGSFDSKQAFLDLFNAYGYDESFTSIDYSQGSYAALCHYLASEIIAFGLQDGSNEANNYGNKYYIPVNPPLVLEIYIENILINPKYWQPLAFALYTDQSGNSRPGAIPDFLNPEWGEVTSFCLKEEDLEILRNFFDFSQYELKIQERERKMVRRNIFFISISKRKSAFSISLYNLSNYVFSLHIFAGSKMG